MASFQSTSTSQAMDPQQLASFHEHLKQSKRVLALLGAGLSASSGLPTFRGAGGLWRTHSAISLATPEAFKQDAGLVWQFYNYRRHMSLSVDPNPAHYALAELARKLPGFQALSQNVDGLCQRAGHPSEQLQLLHGTLFELACEDKNGCGYREENFTDPVVPALAIPKGGEDPTSQEALESAGRDADISDIKVPLARLSRDDLPHCPQCHIALLRPGVVWFGERLPQKVLDKVENFIIKPNSTIDLMIVIGTSAQVYPAAGYIDSARKAGARVCVVNMDVADQPRSGWNEGDWKFQGDAAVIVPELLKPVIGDMTGQGVATYGR